MTDFEQKHIPYPETSAAGPAIASQAFDQASVLAWRGNQNSDNLNLALLGRNLDISSKKTVSDTSQVAPTLVNFKGQWLIGWSGMNGDRTINVANVHFDNDNHITGVGEKRFCGSSDFSPSLSASGDALYIAWAGRDGSHTINIARSADGNNFDRPAIWSGHSSLHSPGVAVHNGRGVLAYVDLNGQLVLVEIDDTVTLAPGHVHRSGDTSSMDVEVSPWGRKFAIAWTGDGGHKLNVAIYDPTPGPSFTKQTFSDSATFGPTISTRRLRQDPNSNVADTEQLVIAWTGTDGAGTLTSAVVSSQPALN